MAEDVAQTEEDGFRWADARSCFSFRERAARAAATGARIVSRTQHTVSAAESLLSRSEANCVSCTRHEHKPAEPASFLVLESSGPVRDGKHLTAGRSRAVEQLGSFQENG